MGFASKFVGLFQGLPDRNVCLVQWLVRCFNYFHTGGIVAETAGRMTFLQFAHHFEYILSGLDLGFGRYAEPMEVGFFLPLDILDG